MTPTTILTYLATAIGAFTVGLVSALLIALILHILMKIKEKKAKKAEATPTSAAEEKSGETPTPETVNETPENVGKATETDEQPTEQTDEQPTEQTAEQPTEQPAEQPTEQTAEQPTEQPTEQPAEQLTPAPVQCECTEKGAKKTADEARELGETNQANLASHIADTAEEERLASIQKNHAKIENLAMRYLTYKKEYSEVQLQLGITGRKVQQLKAASEAADDAAVTADTDALCAEGEYGAILANKGRTYLAIGKKQRLEGASEELAGMQAAADEAENSGLTAADEAGANNEAAQRNAAEAAEAVKAKANVKAEYRGRLEELTLLMESIEKKLREEYKLNDEEINELLNPTA